jgi:hypothetical protein
VKRLPFLILLVAIAACSRRTAMVTTAMVPIPPSGNVKSDLKLAEDVGTTVWNAGLKETVGKQFPSLTEQDAEGLFLRWEQVHLETLRESTTEARLVVGFRHRPSADGAAVVEFCRLRVEQVLVEKLAARHTAQ